MWKYNEFNIGDIIEHNESKDHQFQVRNILRPVPEEVGKYLYHCRLLTPRSPEQNQIFNYQGQDLKLVRPGTRKELAEILNDAVGKEEYEIAQELQRLLDNLG